MLLRFWNKKAETVITSDSCKNRNDITSQSIEVEWHVCPGDGSVQILRRLKVFISEAGHEPDSFPHWIIDGSIFSITSEEG